MTRAQGPLSAAYDAQSACEVVRRSISELCAADHGNDPIILSQWLSRVVDTAPPPAPPTAVAKLQTLTAPARHVSSRPGSVLNYAQIASIRKRLNLTPDQEPLWPGPGGAG